MARRCGKPGCRCASDDEARHRALCPGQTRGGKTTMVHIPADLEPRAASGSRTTNRPPHCPKNSASRAATASSRPGSRWPQPSPRPAAPRPKPPNPNRPARHPDPTAALRREDLRPAREVGEDAGRAPQPPTARILVPRLVVRDVRRAPAQLQRLGAIAPLKEPQPLARRPHPPQRQGVGPSSRRASTRPACVLASKSFSATPAIDFGISASYGLALKESHISANIST